MHAVVIGTGGEAEGIEYGHAWIEVGDMVFDQSNGRDMKVPKDMYYRIGQVSTEKGKMYRYTEQEARKKMLDSGHYGPWDLKSKYEGEGL